MTKEKVKIDNPFVTTGYAGAEYFCDREKETADIIRYLTNGNNVALISPRRYGKSDLLRHCFAQKVIADNYYTFIVDIYSTKTVAEMVAKQSGIPYSISNLKTLAHGQYLMNRFICVSGISADSDLIAKLNEEVFSLTTMQYDTAA